MDPAIVRSDEAERLDFISRLPLEDADGVFGLVVSLARQLLDADIAYVALVVDAERVWHSPIGHIPAGYAVRKVAVSSDAAKRREAVWTPDVGKDEDVGRLREALPNLRFYANTPIYLSSGVAIGALCAASERAQPHDADRAEGMKRLAALAGREAERVTALKELEKARDEAFSANQAKSTFLASMSHEIRTPMNGVLGMAQAMAADDLSEVQRDRLGVIRESGEMLLALLNDILDLSKIEAGKLDLEQAPFEVALLASSTRAAFEQLAAAKGVAFEFDMDASAAGAYLGDRTRIRQIIYNLCSNALKFTERGGVSVRIDDPGDGLRIRVADTGIGIAPDRQAAIFERFSQAESSTTRRFGGTGLGLSIVSELTALMDGTVALSSAPGEGSIFTVVLPLQRLAGAGAASETDTAPAELQTSGLHVLAAEDNEVNRRVLKAILDQTGIDVEFVETGQAALDAWRAGDFDLILMDVEMPGMDGPTASRHIRAEEAARGGARIPIIALTANVMAHQLAEYRAAGMDWHVAKPIDIGALLLTMGQAAAGGDEP